MGGGLMQLVAYGAQDIYLTGNPQITFFKVVYRRHTNFSMEAIAQTFSGTADFGNDVTATISRNGDLVHRMYLEHDAVFDDEPGQSAHNVGLCERYGDSLIKECEIEIGGQRIDKHTKEWNQVWAELTTPESKSYGYKYLTGGFNNTFDSASTTNTNAFGNVQNTMQPTQFGMNINNN